MNANMAGNQVSSHPQPLFRPKGKVSTDFVCLYGLDETVCTGSQRAKRRPQCWP